MLTITLSMALTPLLLLRLRPRPQAPAAAAVECRSSTSEIETDAPRVVIVGMGRMGQIVARILRAQNIPFVALDTSVDTIETDPQLRAACRCSTATRCARKSCRRPRWARPSTSSSPPTTRTATIKTAELVKRLYPHLKMHGPRA